MTEDQIKALQGLTSYPQFEVLRQIALEQKTEATKVSRIDPKKGDIAGQAWGLMFLEQYIDDFLAELHIRPKEIKDKTYE